MVIIFIIQSSVIIPALFYFAFSEKNSIKIARAIKFRTHHSYSAHLVPRIYSIYLINIYNLNTIILFHGKEHDHRIPIVKSRNEIRPKLILTIDFIYKSLQFVSYAYILQTCLG